MNHPIQAEPVFASGKSAGFLRTAFGFPFLSVVFSEMAGVNQSLAEIILAEQQRRPSVTQSNQGGWQSEKDLQTWMAPAIRQLLSHIDLGIYLLMCESIGEENTNKIGKEWHLSAWANVNSSGHFNNVHYHVGGFWSGVYYVQTGRKTEQGVILFRNPTSSSALANTIPAPQEMRDLFPSQMAFQPEPGQLLIFPSWIDHWVTPHFEDQPRISVAFDVFY